MVVAGWSSSQHHILLLYAPALGYRGDSGQAYSAGKFHPQAHPVMEAERLTPFEQRRYRRDAAHVALQRLQSGPRRRIP